MAPTYHALLGFNGDFYGLNPNLKTKQSLLGLSAQVTCHVDVLDDEQTDFHVHICSFTSIALFRLRLLSANLRTAFAFYIATLEHCIARYCPIALLIGLKMEELVSRKRTENHTLYSYTLIGV